jgi:hypothetical protein
MHSPHANAHCNTAASQPDAGSDTLTPATRAAIFSAVYAQGWQQQRRDYKDMVVLANQHGRFYSSVTLRRAVEKGETLSPSGNGSKGFKSPFLVGNHGEFAQSGVNRVLSSSRVWGFTEFILRHLSVSVLISSIHCIRSASKMKTEIAKTTSHQYLRIIVSFREKSASKVVEIYTKSCGLKAG